MPVLNTNIKTFKSYVESPKLYNYKSQLIHIFSSYKKSENTQN